MGEFVTLPAEVQSYIGSEPVDFSISAARAYPKKASRGTILAGIMWLVSVFFWIVLTFGGLFTTGEVRFEANGVPKVATLDNLSPLIGVGLLTLFFFAIGLFILVAGISMSRKKGGYFIGTANRLISYYNGEFISYDWESFSGDISMKGDTIVLNRRGGETKLEHKATGISFTVGDSQEREGQKIYISGIHNVLEIERICRQRIQEHDPTPPQTV